METTVWKSPLGPIELSARDGRLAKVELCAPNGVPVREAAPSLAPYLRALERYFAGADPAIGWEAIDLSGCTPFQRRVFEELARVPFGELVSYGELAGRLGMPRGARAVGGAVGSNPLPIFIPCHRVVAADGGLGGFGAGLPWKVRLLCHEGWSVTEGKVR